MNARFGVGVVLLLLATGVTAALERPPSAGERLSLSFQDVEVRSVLKVLADFTGTNLVVSDAVQGKVTLRLQDVPWEQALDLVLRSKSLGRRQDGNVLLVAPLAELAGQERQALAAQPPAVLAREL
ncbi:type IV pilus secretin PilQ, partial [Pseudomonas sp. MAFF212428]|nr:type IV pilus secretin PilQ [Pseudomonas brassicae]